MARTFAQTAVARQSEAAPFALTVLLGLSCAVAWAIVLLGLRQIGLPLSDTTIAVFAGGVLTISVATLNLFAAPRD